MQPGNLLDEEDLRRPTPRAKLKLLKSPVIGSTDSRDSIVEPELSGVDQYHRTATLGAAGFPTYHGEHKGLPIFRKFEDASLLELFTDLFFAANYTVFTQTQKVTNTNTLATYVGYFGTLWITWFLVTLYDVRFVTDCVFERITRAIHLGVLIGFAVVAPKFDPADQDRDTMRIMCVEYLSVLWHVRKFKQALLPIGLQVCFSFACAFIYLGITFRFRDYDSRVFVVWYIVSAAEMGITTGAAAWWDVLVFTRTHLMKRLTLLTVIILGDGIIVLAQDVVVIVQTPNAWTACAAIYCVFLVYFDWFREQYLPRWRQIYWVCLHLPFHLALVLFMHGFTQLIMWTKILDVLWHEADISESVTSDYDRIANMTSQNVSQSLQDDISGFFDDYGRHNSWAAIVFGLALENISSLPDEIWSEHPRILDAAFYGHPLDDGFEKSDSFQDLRAAVVAILSTMMTALFETFGVEITKELIEERESRNETLLQSAFQLDVVNQALNRFEIVFVYGYIAGGVTLILMTVLTVIARKRPWRTWPIVRNVLNVLIGLMLAGLCGLAFSETTGSRYIRDGMSIPTITITWLVILILTHLGAATPVVNRTILNKSSTSSDPETNEKMSGENRNLSWHGGGGVSPGQMTLTEEQVAPQRTQTSFYGQIGEDGTSYGQPNRYSHEQDVNDTAQGYGHPSSTATYNMQEAEYGRRPLEQPSPMSTHVSSVPVSRGDNVSPGSYMGQSTAHDSRGQR